MHIYSPNYAAELYGARLPSVFDDLKSYVADFGEVTKGRTGNTKTVFGVTFTLTPDDQAQVIKVVSPRRANMDIERYVEAMKTGKGLPEFGTEDGEPFYGRALKAPLNRVLTALKADPTSRQALVTISDRTCFNTYQLQISNGKLITILSARSCHVKNGLPRDAYFWITELHYPAAKALGIPPGGMVFNIGNLHSTYAGAVRV